MSAFRSTLWRCDRCDLEQRQEPNDQPRQWLGLALFDPPESSEPLDRGGTKRRHLCPECVAALDRFLTRANL